MNSHDLDLIENLTYDELQLGQQQTLIRRLQADDILAFAAVSGDTNPAHLDPDYASHTPFHGVIAHGMWAASLISALLGTRFPGAGTIYLHQDLHFLRPVHVGDTLTVTATVVAKEEGKRSVELDCRVINQHGEAVLTGMARVLAPAEKLRHRRIAPHRIQLLPGAS
ncbi:3-hydroxybutyryl-CoA dehydratase [Aquabacterium fontiphilum]|uniref:MaoC/PaaZ C-terminal domain-containing protein n=1 Tax=Aquabacterium fontiphilum TaxID=450365 RepID=UPI0013768778|nr:MaoC/PaaZ C-terminal domain-containing protein [Aquabacterium fontiphilum]NBD19511.1 3-hydroxybutyryl-CoA dehydratase [Aquabacterium fontiphilum]